MTIAPCADAVVTETAASPKAWCSTLRLASTVCTRDSGAIRHSRPHHPVREYTAVSVASQRWVR